MKAFAAAPPLFKEIAMSMFQIGADPQFVRNQNFHDACRTGDKETALRLLDENPDDQFLIDITRSDMSAVLMAADGQHWDLCKELIERGADLNISNLHGYCALHVFAIHGQEDLLKLAVENACFVSKKNKRGMAAIHFAAEANQLGAVETLLSLGAEINSMTKDKNTPIHYAARHGNVDMVRAMVAHGAYVHAENDMGETPVTLAATDEMRSILEEADLTRATVEAQAKRDAEAKANAEANPGAPVAPPPSRRILKA
jgi:ankyrin repeat protein